jgi:hypothetical protein
MDDGTQSLEKELTSDIVPRTGDYSASVQVYIILKEGIRELISVFGKRTEGCK